MQTESPNCQRAYQLCYCFCNAYSGWYDWFFLAFGAQVSGGTAFAWTVGFAEHIKLPKKPGAEWSMWDCPFSSFFFLYPSLFIYSWSGGRKERLTKTEKRLTNKNRASRFNIRIRSQMFSLFLSSHKHLIVRNFVQKYSFYSPRINAGALSVVACHTISLLRVSFMKTSIFYS